VAVQPGPRATRILAGLVLFVGTFGAALGAGTHLLERLDATRIVVIGSGRAVSVLLTDGDARLLLAAGDDPAGFGNGWRRWRGLAPVARLDVLLTEGEDDPVAAGAIDDLSPRWQAAILPPEPGQSRLPGVPPLDAPLQLRLGPNLAVTIETIPAPADGSSAGAWRMLVERGQTIVAVVPDGAAAARFAWDRPVAALIVLRSDVANAVAVAAPKALVVPAIVQGRTLRSEVAPIVRDGLWTLRVAPGEIASLAFAVDGLRLPGESDWLAPAATPGTAAVSTLAADRRLKGWRRRRGTR
jgi:hypothetical protein